jgi:hypothetical protein
MDTTKQHLQGGQLVVWLASEHHPINFALAARIRGAFAPEQFQQALDTLRRTYPPLSMRATKESDGDVYLVPDPALRIPVRTLERKHAAHWVDEVTAELDRAFDLLHNPPLRLVWLREGDVSEILFVCPHALADGFAVAYLVRDFLMFLSDPADAVTMPLTQLMPELIPDFPGRSIAILRAKLKVGLLKLFLSHRSKQEAPQTHAVKRNDPTYHVSPWVLTSAQTSALVTRSRAEGTTVHAALCTAFLRAFGEFYGDSWKRKIQSPVSLRDRLTHPVGESFGLFVNLVEFRINCAPDRDFWEVARAIKQGFIRRTADQRIFDSLIEANVAMTTLSQVITPQIMAELFMAVDHDLSISNLGRLDFPMRYGALQLDALFGPILGGDPEDIVLGVLTIGGQMHFSLSFTDLKMTPLEAEQIKASAMRWLADATNNFTL